MANLGRKQLIQVFEQALERSATYRRIGELTNPGHFMFDGVEYYVYVKNVSWAHFENSPDVWRAQLTNIDELNEIKQTDAIFVLLGYDDENNVFATWNPYKAKQRIGTAKSPSFYTRLSLQQEVAQRHILKKMTLNNGLEVLAFPIDLLPDYLLNIDYFFPDNTDYVAMGSKRRVEANNAYKELTSPKRIAEFERYLQDGQMDEDEARLFAKAIRTLLNDNHLSRNRKVFLAHDSLAEYSDAYKEFLALDEIKQLDEQDDNIYSYALPAFISFLQEENNVEPQDDSLEDEPEDSHDEHDERPSDVAAEDIVPNCDEAEPYDYRVDMATDDWETAYTDAKGNLTRIANPELLERLKPDLCGEYTSLPSAYNTVSEYYGDRFQNMEMKDWNTLFKQIDWDSPADSKPEPLKAKRTKIRVQFPTGELSCENQVVKTFLRVIEYAGPERVAALGIQYLGGDLVSREGNPKYMSACKPVGDYLVNTCSSTPKKVELLKEIDKALDLDLIIFTI